MRLASTYRATRDRSASLRRWARSASVDVAINTGYRLAEAAVASMLRRHCKRADA
jgi:hypothetical protein